MKKDLIQFNVIERLQEIEETARVALAQRQRSQPAIEITAGTEEYRHLVPSPRRSRMFLRHGEGHGAFSDVTLTSPVRQATA